MPRKTKNKNLGRECVKMKNELVDRLHYKEVNDDKLKDIVSCKSKAKQNNEV